MPCPRLLLTALAAVAALVPAQAQAADTVLAPANGAAAITAYDGRVVFSRLDPMTGKWALVRWQAGVVDVLPVAERSVPFDADAGSDRAGNPVVVYSRCRQDPTTSLAGLAPAADWETARGCDLYELNLSGTAAEHKLATASSASASETTPSMWRGALAFARHTDGGAVPKILYLPAGSKRPRRLGGGAVQACTGATGCDFKGSHDDVEQLDLGPSRAAYVWRMTGGATYGIGLVWELRGAPTAGGYSTLLDSGLVSGACGFGLPSAPDASASPIGYLAAGAECDVTKTSFATADPVTGDHTTADTPGGLAAGAARDGDTIYWLRVTGPAANVPVPGVTSCTVATAQCQLVASSLPTYAPSPRVSQSTPADLDLARSDMGYSWVRGPAGTRLLRPPARIPCAPSKQVAYVATSARWSSGHHSVQVLRQDPGHLSRPIGSRQSRSSSLGGLDSRLLHCGDRARFTYAVTTAGRTQRVSFGVVRATLPAK
ncbi:MAG TPA: hypothetical protein VHZ75_08655 [Solirubrobacteraceae bacterium]|jgi:hypothetical protein|nr:hypothetical protein [Solirubrobacteraceae bacterium]